ncbi:MAG TPA: hypothetical protein VJB09_02150 [Candidatus Paceibacterota bacterium]
MKKSALVLAPLFFLVSDVSSQFFSPETFTVVYHERIFCRYTCEFETQTVTAFILTGKREVTTLSYVNHCDTLSVSKTVGKYHSLPKRFCEFYPCEFPHKRIKNKKPTKEEIDDFPKIIYFLERNIRPRLTRI